MVAVEEVSFRSDGVRIAGDLYWPEAAADPVACVVMGHGGSATKRLGLPAYARTFASHGIAVLTFDYRHFGESDGDPRQVIRVAEQHDDYRAAVRFARAHQRIDPHKVALWGTSLSGGHVLAVAATDPHIAAVVSQVPMIDGWHRGRSLRERLDWSLTRRTVQFTAAAVRDVVQDRLRQAPFLVPVVAEPGRVAVFTEPEAEMAFSSLGGEAAGWRNALAPRFIFTLPRYRAGTAERIQAPVLMCLADRDQQASSGYAAHIASLIRHVEIRHYPVGHFAVYIEPLRGQIAISQANFLQRHAGRHGLTI